jgi:hypothetical protein
MCVALSKAIVLAAIAVRKGDAAVSVETIAVPEAPAPPPPPTKKRPAFELSHRQYRRLRRRVEALEGGTHRRELWPTGRERNFLRQCLTAGLE